MCRSELSSAVVSQDESTDHAAPAAPKSRSRREELRLVMLKRKYDHAVAIDILKAHRRDESLDRRIDPRGRIVCAKNRACTANGSCYRPITRFVQSARQWDWALSSCSR